MARPNVTVIINDQSFVISGTESGGQHRSGFIVGEGGILSAVGSTTERQQGYMEIPTTNDWFGRLKSAASCAFVGETADKSIPFFHCLDAGCTGNNATGGNQFAGGTFQRWPFGPTGSWASDWWCVHNYLLYGGKAIVGATGTVTNKVSPESTLSNKSIDLDSVFGNSGSNSYVTNVVNSRGDCIGIHHVITQDTITSSSPDKSTSNENIVSVFGEKYHVDISRLSTSVVTDSNLIRTPLTADVAGCLARTDRIASPWFSPGGTTRGRILDVVKLAKDLTDADQDNLYDNGINPVVTFSGEGTVLFGDKTNKTTTSTLSRINVARLFLYLKKVVGSAARSLLFEQNDDITRNLFINAITPLLENIRGQRGITDFKVICDETNNTPDIVDSNQFVADVFIKPTKSINFIRLRFTNVGEGVDLS